MVPSFTLVGEVAYPVSDASAAPKSSAAVNPLGPVIVGVGGGDFCTVPKERQTCIDELDA
jgi:hypothetical protein